MEGGGLKHGTHATSYAMVAVIGTHIFPQDLTVFSGGIT